MSNEDRLITEDDTRELFGGDGGGGVFTPLPSNRELSDYSGSHASLSPLPPFPNAPSYEPVPEPSVFGKAGFGTKAGTMPLPAKSQASLLVKRYKSAQPGVERDMIRRQAADAFGKLDTQGKLDFNSRLNAEARIRELNREMDALRSQIAQNQEMGARAEASGAAARYDAALEAGSKPGGGAMPRRYFKPGLGYVTELGSRMPDSERANLTALAMLARQRANGDKGGHAVVIGPYGVFDRTAYRTENAPEGAVPAGDHAPGVSVVQPDRWSAQQVYDPSTWERNQSLRESVAARNIRLRDVADEKRQLLAAAEDRQRRSDAAIGALGAGVQPSDDQLYEQMAANAAVERAQKAVREAEAAQRSGETRMRIDPVTGLAQTKTRGEWEAERAARAEAERQRRLNAAANRRPDIPIGLAPQAQAALAVEQERARQAALGQLVDGGTPGGGALERPPVDWGNSEDNALADQLRAAGLPEREIVPEVLKQRAVRANNEASLARINAQTQGWLQNGAARAQDAQNLLAQRIRFASELEAQRQGGRMELADFNAKARAALAEAGRQVGLSNVDYNALANVLENMPFIENEKVEGWVARARAAILPYIPQNASDETVEMLLTAYIAGQAAAPGRFPRTAEPAAS